MKSMQRQRGFTLIELLIVIAIIGVLSTMAVGNYRKSIVRAKEAALRENLFVMRSQINNYFADKGEYPFDLQTLVDDEYLHSIPKDPVTDSPDTWVVTYADIGDEEDLAEEQGIENVHSGADSFGLDGTPYGDW